MKYRFAAVGLLLILAWLELSTLAVTTPTVDEPLHIMRGSAYIRRDEERYLMNGPVLSNAFSGLALLLEPRLQLPPVEDPLWLKAASMEHPDQFIWNNAVPPERIFFWGRLPIIAVSLILGAFVFRWARERTSELPALGALTLCVFCPNLLAHSRLATTDSVTAATFFISVYAFDRALRKPRLSSAIFSGAAFGFALAAKFSAAALPLAFAIQAAVYAWQARRERQIRLKPAVIWASTLVLGAITLWGIYRFRIGPIEPGGPSVPAPYYWAEWKAFNAYLQDPLPGYLFGQFSQHGWWYYYPITFLVKTPLPVLIFLILALVRTFRARSWLKDLPVYLAPGLFFGALLFSPHDLGYRYLLPVLPFIFVASADVMAAALKARWTGIVAGLLIAWQVVGTLRYYPYYLTFFNELAGGPDRGRYILSDSNIDWGQDLIGLQQYADQNHIDRLKLSYFGIAHPDYYGVRADLLPPLLTGIQDQPRWKLRTFQPADPLPGTYAISVVNLMRPDGPYAVFRDRKPDAMIGGSIYVYTVLPHGAPIDLALGGLQIDQIDANTYARFNTNDVRPRWFSPANSLIAPPGQAWLAVVDQTLAPELASFFDGVTPEFRARSLTKDRPYRVYHFDLNQRLAAAAQNSELTAYLSTELYPQPDQIISATLPVKFDDAAELIGYRVITQTQSRDVSLITFWRAANPMTAPTELFVHALNAEGQTIAQQDGFGASAYGWQAGDLFAQVSRLSIPPDSGAVWIEIGLYHPDSGARLPVMVDGQAVDQRLLLKQINKK